MNPDKLLALLMGKKWDTIETFPYQVPDDFRGTNERWRYGGKSYIQLTNYIHPDFSRPADRDEFFTWLCRERPEMWDEFLSHACEAWLKTPDTRFYPWLFFDKDNPARPRDLMVEWLSLPGTVERFGTIECGCLDGHEAYLATEDGDVDFRMCPECKGEKRVLSEWARYVKEGEDA